MVKKRILFFVFLVFFLCITLMTEFFHQEKTIERIDLCPIGIWELNTIAVASLCLLVLLIIFILLRSLYLFNDKIRFYSPFYCYCQRAPPWKY